MTIEITAHLIYLFFCLTFIGGFTVGAFIGLYNFIKTKDNIIGTIILSVMDLILAIFNVIVVIVTAPFKIGLVIWGLVS